MSKLRANRPSGQAQKQEFVSPVERIYFEWEKALAANDPEALLALYAPVGGELLNSGGHRRLV
jgi:hypothetical protein